MLLSVWVFHGCEDLAHNVIGTRRKQRLYLSFQFFPLPFRSMFNRNGLGISSNLLLLLIEDETHFLVDCQSFSSIRDMLFSKLEPKIPFLRLQSHESLLSHLMNSTDYFINIQLISFISTCFELRDKLISGIINPTDG